MVLASETLWRGFLSVLVFNVGAWVGGFLTVCIFRIPREIPIFKNRPFCPACRTPIKWCHNIPVLSWLLLRGRCPDFNASISLRYPGVEFLTATLFLLVWLKYDAAGSGAPLGMSPVMDWKVIPVLWLAVSGLILAAIVDGEHLIFPDRVTLGGILAGLVLSMAVPALHGRETALSSLAAAGLGALVGLGTFWGFAVLGKVVFGKPGVGRGDIKLMGAIGAFFGVRGFVFIVPVQYHCDASCP